MAVPFEMEVQRLVKAGVLTKLMNFRTSSNPAALLSFENTVGGRRLVAKIAYDFLRPASESFELCVTEELDEQAPEVISVRRHGSIEHLVQAGRGFLCYYEKNNATRQARKVAITVRVDEKLHEAFVAAVEATGECQSVVLRQLMRFFLGVGPDPRFYSKKL
jgi:hypothetical protein